MVMGHVFDLRDGKERMVIEIGMCDAHDPNTPLPPSVQRELTLVYDAELVQVSVAFVGICSVCLSAIGVAVGGIVGAIAFPMSFQLLLYLWMCFCRWSSGVFAFQACKKHREGKLR